MEINHSHVVIDACCMLNFCASGHFIKILKSIPAQVVVTEVVREKELITLQRLKDTENAGAIQFEQAIGQGLILVVDFESELEEETFVNYASQLGDDGESATFAIAINRGWAIATDDKKATSFFQKEAPHLRILSTLEIIKYWSEEANLTPTERSTVLTAIKTEGRYRPHKNHSLISWWEKSIQQS
jgi:predicted nucleic acid-binding protein